MLFLTRFYRACFLMGAFSLHFACSQQADDRQASNSAPDLACTAALAPLPLYYAQGFALEAGEGFYKLLIFNTQVSPTDTLRYLLLPKGCSKPAAYTHWTSIGLPVQRMVVFATTHVGMLASLAATDRLMAMSGGKYVYDSLVRQKLASGAIVDLGDGAMPSQEVLMGLRPDLVMTSSASAFQPAKFQALYAAGIPVMPNLEWIERSVLGRAEWLKLIGVLLGKAEQAAHRFAEVEQAYTRLAKLTKSVNHRPLLISGMPFQGNWHVPGRNSFKGQLYHDAGARWPWENEHEQVSFSVGFEEMYRQGVQADFWLETGEGRNLRELLMADARFAEFRPVKRGQVYNNNARISPNGAGNDYWESGVVNPHSVLADLIYIFHPELLPGHQLHYFRHLE